MYYQSIYVNILAWINNHSMLTRCFQSSRRETSNQDRFIYSTTLIYFFFFR